MKKVFFAVLLCLLFIPIAYAAPGAPELSYSISGTDVTINWTETTGATGYRFYYAPYPGADPIQNIDVGNLTGATTIPLFDGAAFYIAVEAYDGSGESTLSNVTYFVVGEAQALQTPSISFPTNNGTLTQGENMTWTDGNSSGSNYLVFAYAEGCTGAVITSNTGSSDDLINGKTWATSTFLGNSPKWVVQVLAYEGSLPDLGGYQNLIRESQCQVPYLTEEFDSASSWSDPITFSYSAD